MDEQITITLPKATFDMAREFIKDFGAALDAADAKIKSDIKSKDAADKMDQLAGIEADPGAADLAGFGQELSGLSNRNLGI